ncbi:MAG: saccharopine dehydrogenase C-terminal domain-containing protein [Holophaga sp.]|jgi:saccharopine dehydrogenase-like NADP-dependent oxidoreductase
MKHVLVLGAGRVARPCVQYLQRYDWLELTIVEPSRENLDRVAGSHPRTTAVNQALPQDVAGFIAARRPDLVLNLLPAEFRGRMAEACLQAGVNLMFPSYADASIRAMEPRLRQAGLTWLAELGVDPGIDHMSAARTINQVHAGGGKVESFTSVCGAIPSAEANTNPWGYKLSWAPESLIGASRRTARIMVDGKVVEWPDGETYQHVHLEEVRGLGWYEVYANADSLPYLETYAIPECRNIYRGTIRYVGWCETIVAMNELGLFSQEPEDLAGLTFNAFTARKCGASKAAGAAQALCARLNLEPSSAIFERLQWLGFLDEQPVPAEARCSRDVVRALYGEKLYFEPGERDLIVLKDEVTAAYPDGTRKRHTSTLIDFGIPGGDSSIARTTGLPPAIVARLFLEGRIPGRGLVLPTLPEIYEPCLAELEKEGIRLQETTTLL